MTSASKIANLARLTAESPNEAVLAELRTLEKKMGLVLTLVRRGRHDHCRGAESFRVLQFKASVWAVIVDSQAAAEAEEARAMERARRDERDERWTDEGDSRSDADSDV